MKKISESLIVKLEPYLDDHNFSLALRHLKDYYDDVYKHEDQVSMADLKEDLEKVGVKFSISLTFI